MTAVDNSLRAAELTVPGGGLQHRRQARARTSGMARATRDTLDLLAHLEGGALTVGLPGHAQLFLGRGEPAADWTVHDESVFERILGCGDIALGETYMEGLWHSRDLTALLTLLARNRDALARGVYGRRLALLGHWLRHRLRANTRQGARRNIEAHYDLGNDFYALWLDRTMSYSSAVFEHPDESLASAQLRKYRRILDRIAPSPGQTILEIGCGWGGFAEVAATEYGCRVLGLTLSGSQLEFARRRALRGGFDAQVEFALCDYRDVRGRYDHIVSIEMVEAVGERFWPTWFEQLSARLKPGGRAVVQAITIDDALFGTYRRGTDFIQRYIFPGGMLPSVPVFAEGARRAGLALEADFAFGKDYALTLQRWRQAFGQHPEALAARGFDERFQRMWHFYLAYCEAGFLAGNIDVHQFELRHAG